MVKCSFCGREFARGSGKLVITKVGKLNYFCSSKCEKSAFKFDRLPGKLAWVKKIKSA